MTRAPRWLPLAALLGACQTSGAAPEPEPPAVSVASAEPVRAPPAAASRTRAEKPDTRRYPWLGEKGVPEVAGDLEQRFAPPRGFSRVALAPGSFGHWLRRMPLAAKGTPVRTYRGDVLLPGDDPRIAGVVALDIGSGDLQQCADAVIRLHAEWSWSRGKPNVSYRAAAGLPLPFERWARGERIRAKGASISWVPGSAPASDHKAFRKYLDSVFAWANTVSLDKQARAVKADELRPGDFFVLPGNPGHTVIVLDLAQRGGERVALLGQSYMPAQSFQVLRPSRDAVWFSLDSEQPVSTPFWRPFPWTSLRRLD